jgi:hypothetical protein
MRNAERGLRNLKSAIARLQADDPFPAFSAMTALPAFTPPRHTNVTIKLQTRRDFDDNLSRSTPPIHLCAF